MVNTKGFTLLELSIVLVIIGILATLSVINYSSSKERIADKEAISNLKILQSAQKGYFVEMDGYYPSSGNVSDIWAINANLTVAISNSSSRNWNYTVYSSGCVQARRTDSGQRYLNLTITNDTDPNSTITCP